MDALRSLEKVNRELSENELLTREAQANRASIVVKLVDARERLDSLKAQLQTFQKLNYGALKLRLQEFQESNALPEIFIHAGYEALKEIQRQESVSVRFKVTTVETEICNYQNDSDDLKNKLTELERAHVKLAAHRNYVLNLAEQSVQALKKTHARTEKSLIKAYDSISSRPDSQVSP